MSTERQKNFPALLEGLMGECVGIIAQYEQKRSALLPLMHLFQKHEGYVSREAIDAVAQLLEVTPAEVEGTVSFYTLLYQRPVGKYALQVCRGLACSINGAENIMAYFREKLGVGHLQTTPDGLFSYEEVECLAACDRATCMQVNLEFVYDLTPRKIDEILESIRAGSYAVAAMAQTDKPGSTWAIDQDEQISMGTKSPGAREVPPRCDAAACRCPSSCAACRRAPSSWPSSGSRRGARSPTPLRRLPHAAAGRASSGPGPARSG